MNMQRHGCWERESILNCIIIHHMHKVKFPYINSMERHACGGINMCRCNTLKRKVLLGEFKKYFENKYLTKIL
jgi:hypothetical protein